MPDPNRPSLDSAFSSFRGQLHQVVDFSNAAAPTVVSDKKLVAQLRDSVIVLAVARLDGFFQAVVSLATRHRESDLRALLVQEGHPQAGSCSLPVLVKLVRRKVSFEKEARRLDGVFHFLFGCSVWPNDEVRELVLDLVLLRNLIVHSDGHDWSEDGVHEAAYASQFRRAVVLDERRDGEFVTYSVNSMKALLFFRTATVAIGDQLQYLKARLVDDMTWASPRS
jgi:hypothetical protein